MIPKYRAWHKPMQRMSEVLAISYERQKVKIRHLRGTTHMTVPFDDVVLMQSTGLFDYFGKEIFDGDIIQNADGTTYQIMYIKEHGHLEYVDNDDEYHHSDIFFEDIESYRIVGNIYENLEPVEDK